MFDPIFDVNLFLENFSGLVSGISAAITFVVIFAIAFFQFVDDELDSIGEVAIVLVVFPILAGVVAFAATAGLALIIGYLWFPTTILILIIFLGFIARGVRRLQKNIKAHVKDKNAHGGN